MKRYGWILVLAAALAACGKKEPPPAPPNLSAPERPSASGTVPGTSAQLPAEAEVTASSGPVRMTLRIYKTRIKAKKDIFEPFDPAKSLLYQLELKNIGKKRFLVTSSIFRWPGNLPSDHMNITLDVVGPGGDHPYLDGMTEVEPPKYGFLPMPGDKEGLALEAKWRKEGVALPKMVQWFGERAKALYQKDHPGEDLPREEDTSFWLEPGASTTTAAWVRLTPSDRVWDRKPPPFGQFAEVAIIDTRQPGKYRVRAVYNYEIRAEFLRKYKYVRVDEDDVKFDTPFIEFEVQP